jgi:hypothetical protein
VVERGQAPSDSSQCCQTLQILFSGMSSIFFFLGGEGGMTLSIMEQHVLKNVNNCLNINIYPYLDSSGGQSSIIYLNVVNFFNNNDN